MRGERNEWDCTCDFCKNHKCYLNRECTECLDPKCEARK